MIGIHASDCSIASQPSTMEDTQAGPTALPQVLQQPVALFQRLLCNHKMKLRRRCAAIISSASSTAKAVGPNTQVVCCFRSNHGRPIVVVVITDKFIMVVCSRYYLRSACGSHLQTCTCSSSQPSNRSSNISSKRNSSYDRGHGLQKMFVDLSASTLSVLTAQHRHWQW